MKPFFFVLLIGLASISASGQKAAIYQSNGYAIGGYDPVSFFTERKAVKGDVQHLIEWENTKWLFSSQANLERFLKEPDKYAPQYGGYCAYGMARGYKAPTEIDTWTIISDKLYFNYNQKVKESWNKEATKYIEQANINWKNVKDRD